MNAAHAQLCKPHVMFWHSHAHFHIQCRILHNLVTTSHVTVLISLDEHTPDDCSSGLAHRTHIPEAAVHALQLVSKQAGPAAVERPALVAAPVAASLMLPGLLTQPEHSEAAELQRRLQTCSTSNCKFSLNCSDPTCSVTVIAKKTRTKPISHSKLGGCAMLSC